MSAGDPIGPRQHGIHDQDIESIRAAQLLIEEKLCAAVTRETPEATTQPARGQPVTWTLRDVHIRNRRQDYRLRTHRAHGAGEPIADHDTHTLTATRQFGNNRQHRMHMPRHGVRHKNKDSHQKVVAQDYETQTWTPTDQGYYSRAKMRRQRGT